MKVLQVKNDSEADKAIELMLGPDGHSCETTTYGEDAARLAQKNRRPAVRDVGFKERRSAARAKMLKRGQIVYNNGHCVIDCLVLNRSETGAALQPTQSSCAVLPKYPENFGLRFENEPSCNCVVCWQHGIKLGVRFVDE